EFLIQAVRLDNSAQLSEGGTPNVIRRKRLMTEVKVARYGSWKSPITSDLIVTGSIGLGQIAMDGEDVYWVETRPQEKGRYVVVKLGPDGRTVDVTPMPVDDR